MRLLSADELRNRGITYSRYQLYRLEAAGRFPRRVAIGENRVAWVESEIDEWIKNKIRERDAAIESAA
jgi:prophage regulatory protein